MAEQAKLLGVPELLEVPGLLGVTELAALAELAAPLAPVLAGGTRGSGSPSPPVQLEWAVAGPPDPQPPASDVPLSPVTRWAGDHPPAGWGPPPRLAGAAAAGTTCPCSRTAGCGLVSAVLLEPLRLLSHSCLCKYHGKKT